MSLNQAIALMQKTFHFQGAVDTTVTNNFTSQPEINTVDTTRSVTSWEQDEMLQEVSKEFGKTGIKGPPINEK